MGFTGFGIDYRVYRAHRDYRDYGDHGSIFLRHFWAMDCDREAKAGYPLAKQFGVQGVRFMGTKRVPTFQHLTHG